MSSPRPLQVALVGLGDIATTAHLPALLRHEGFELVAAVEPHDERRRAAAELLPAGCALTADLPADLSGWDLAILATPPWVTTGLATALTAAGVHVLAEKPVATSSRELVEALAAHPALSALTQVGLTYRHHPNFQYLVEIVRSRRLGSSLTYSIRVHDEVANPHDQVHRERVIEALRHGSALFHEGLHLLDWLRELSGEQWRVEAASARLTDEDLPGPNLCTAALGGSRGSTASLEVGWLAAVAAPSALWVVGELGYAQLDVQTFALTITTNGLVESLAAESDRTTAAFDGQLCAVHDWVRGRRKASPEVAAMVSLLELLEQIHAAGQQR